MQIFPRDGNRWIYLPYVAELQARAVPFNMANADSISAISGEPEVPWSWFNLFQKEIWATNSSIEDELECNCLHYIQVYSGKHWWSYIGLWNGRHGTIGVTICYFSVHSIILFCPGNMKSKYFRILHNIDLHLPLNKKAIQVCFIIIIFFLHNFLNFGMEWGIHSLLI